jgi:hypothetical protein
LFLLEIDFQALKLLVEGLRTRVDTLETENKELKFRLNALESVEDEKDQVESEHGLQLSKEKKRNHNSSVHRYK